MISLRRLRIRRFAARFARRRGDRVCGHVPLMLTMYFGMVEISTGVAIDRKVTMVSRTLSDLASQSTTVTVQTI